MLRAKDEARMSEKVPVITRAKLDAMRRVRDDAGVGVREEMALRLQRDGLASVRWLHPGRGGWRVKLTEAGVSTLRDFEPRQKPVTDPDGMIRATLRRRDGTCVRRIPLCDNDEFVFCLLTDSYYDRTNGCTYVERFWPHHHQRIKEKVAATSGDPLDVARAAAGLPIWWHGGTF